MSRQSNNKTTAGVLLYSLPNHGWFPPDKVKAGSKYDTPEIVIRRARNAVLLRKRPWNEQVQYDWSIEACGKNRPNETWKPLDLWRWSDASIEILALKANEGSTDAALELAKLARDATVKLTKICKAKPELVRQLARPSRYWPVLKTKRERLSTDETDLFAKIQLGEDDFIEMDAQSAKWKPDDAGIIAYGLLLYVRLAYLTPPGKTARYHGHNVSFGLWNSRAKQKLKADFCDDTAPCWWHFAREVFLSTYPKPHVVEELNRLVTNTRKRRSPGRLNQAILRMLESRFLSFARNTS